MGSGEHHFEEGCTAELSCTYRTHSFHRSSWKLVEGSIDIEKTKSNRDVVNQANLSIFEGTEISH